MLSLQKCIICRCIYVLSLRTYVLSAGVHMCCHYRHLYYLQDYKCLVTTDICIICSITNVLSLQTSVLSAGLKMSCHYRHLYYLQDYKCLVTTDICIICRRPQRHRTVKAVQAEAVHTKHYRIFRTRVSPQSDT